MKKNTYKGYVLALIATIAFSNVYIFSKAALNQIHLFQFGVYWCGFAVILSFLYALTSKKLPQIKTFGKKQFGVLILLGVLEILTTTSFFISIHIIPDPAVTSFIGNMFPVLVTIGGVVVLKEKFGWIEGFGILLALIGTFIISYSGGTSLKTLFIAGTGVVLINAILATTATLIVKVHVKGISPEILNMNRYTWLFLCYTIILLFRNDSLIVPSSAIKDTFIGAGLEIIAILTVYHSYRLIDVSRSTIIQTSKGLFVLLGGFLFFHTLPATYQIFGGILTVIGIMIMALAQANIFKKQGKA
jgi:drug/metabolite transporter (DMT)-like permease